MEPSLKAYAAPITLGFTPANGDLIGGTVNGVEVNGKWISSSGGVKLYEGALDVSTYGDDDGQYVCSVGIIDGQAVIAMESKSAPTTDYELHLYRYTPADIVQIPQEYVEGLEDVAENANAAKTAAETAQSTANSAKTTAETAQSTANTAKTAAETAQSTANAAKTAAIFTEPKGNYKTSGSGCFGFGLSYNNNNNAIGFFRSSNGAGAIVGILGRSLAEWNTSRILSSTELFLLQELPVLTPTQLRLLPSANSSYTKTSMVTLGSKYGYNGASLTIDGYGIIINSSTPDSTKKFKITVDDTGTISATEVTT